MKNLMMNIIVLFFHLSCFGQIYFDPATSGAMAAHSAIIDGQLNKSNERLTLIQRSQLAVTGQLTVVNDLQRQIYRGLSEVSAAVRSLLAVKDIVDIGEDVAEDLKKAMDLAASDPALLLFAEGGAREFKTRATSLATEVGSFVLQGGKDNLMDSGERAKLLNRIVNELSILRGVAYGMYRTMYWAKQRGWLNALNPYSGFINIDKNIADDIIRDVKYFKP